MSSLPLLSSAAAGQPSSSRFASCFVAKPARGFQVLRIDGYSWTKALPGGERITSKLFIIGGRSWRVDYYPNGADGSRDESDSIALYLRLVVDHGITKERVRAQYRFSLLDLDGNAAYERPEETAIFTSARPQPLMPESYTYGLGLPVDDTGGGGQAPATSTVAEDIGCGYAAFITREELESRRDSLLKEDCLAIRCDVGVTEISGPGLRRQVGARVPGAPHVRIDGYSWTRALPGGERITSEPFILSGRSWCVDYYPNGVDTSRDEPDAITLYLRLVGGADYYQKERVRAHCHMAFYKYGLAFLAGTGFGAVTTSLRNDRCPLRRRQHCHQHHHRCGCGFAGEGEMSTTTTCGRRRAGMGGRDAPKKGGSKEKKGDQTSYDKEESD
ncbi:hypothetical protein BAE44_0006517 [Dichanthelium oligosanthes]|uniref:MATH domain-containing protein n=1 Tax=Dichanthelium oligosanthes TaxID=888268 RepID=A0A1E5W541_9POAL|nr:hypothetical protein BAE44_0006517 [Dichanthelium oligosanthes]